MKTKGGFGRIAFLQFSLSLALLSAAASASGARVSPPPGLVSWWAAEGDALDATGANPATLVNGASFAPGEVGQAFAFGSGNQVVIVSNSPSLNPTGEVSLEAWVRLSGYPSSDGIVVVAKEDPLNYGTLQYYLGLRLVEGQWVFEPYVGVPSGLHYVNGATPVLLNTWYHAALTYDGASLKLYVNGNLDGSTLASGPLTTGSTPLTIGGFLLGPWNVNGLVDEVSLYNRALSGPEIKAIYSAGSAGKCGTPSAPSIYLQPATQTVFVMQTATFSVGVLGTSPLNYQWTFNGAAIDGETNATLVLTNVQENQAGTYAVQITNTLGSILSSNALLTVSPAPNCVAPPGGLLSWWQGEGNPSDQTGLNNASIVNGVGYAPGMVGQAFALDGQGSYVQVADSPSLDITNELTVELWYKDTGSPAGDHFYGLIAKRAPYPSGANFGLSLYLGSSGYLQAYLQDPNYYGYQNTTCAVPTAGVFHHVAATYVQKTSEQVELRLYVDGQLASTGVLSANLSRTVNNAPVTIGADNRFEDYFVGLIDEPTIYRRALSAGEVLAIFNAGVSGKCQVPSPVAIYSQPADQIITAGQTATFSVGASGSAPISYQWNLNGTGIPGATNQTLLLTNVQTTQAGAYSVLVSNTVGGVLSSNALLTVNEAPPCTPPATGLVSWWRGENDLLDFLGGNDGKALGVMSYTTGEVGQAFNFDGTSNAIVIPPSTNLAVQSFTIEAWINPSDISIPRPVVEYGGPGSYAGPALWYSSNPGGAGIPGALYGVVRGLNPNQAVEVGSIGGLVAPNRWSHVAFTFDPVAGVASLFFNGTNVGSTTFSFFLQPNSTNAVNIGYRPMGSAEVWGGRRHVGGIDEVSIYGRALTSNEIATIYAAGMAGKCAIPVSPSIYTQPADQVVTVAQTAIFVVGAGGSQPLSYQWNLNGLAIPGATNATIVLTNVQSSQAGGYSVLVTNLAGSVLSSNAMLTVNLPPANVMLANANLNLDGSVTIPVLLIANGNENALGFSLDFPPEFLSFTGLSAGTDSSTAAFFVNTNQAVNGRLGVVISLLTGSTFSTGTQEIAQVTFMPNLLTNAATAPISFGDQPTVRQLSDAQAHSLAAIFTGTTIAIPAAEFEGDVSPRPGGDRALTVTDWVLVGRYAAKLDYPTNASEYQRADCAPRSTSGDGAITVADWVQSGRYAAGIDAAVRAGGPTNDVEPGMVISKEASNILRQQAGPQPKGVSPRQVRVTSTQLAPGMPGSISVLLAAQGNENAAGFTFSFDPAVLTYTGASLGSGATGASLNMNASQAASGELAFVLALPVGGNFAAGDHELVRVNLTAKNSNASSSPLSLTDALARRQVVDTSANTLVTDFVNGSIVVNPVPALNIVSDGQNVVLSWPLWATNFTLQEAGGPFTSTPTFTNSLVAPVIVRDQSTATVPAAGTTKLYRLQSK